MVGQAKTRSQLERLAALTILCGPAGSGKKTLLKESLVGKQTYWCTDIKADTIREMITNSYKVISPTIFVVCDIDDISAAAENSLLKITEEPPNNAKFILTCRDINNVLSTIKSRANVINMENYTEGQLREYYNNDNDYIYRVCNTPGDLDLIQKNGISELYEFAELVANNVKKVSMGNALKLVDRIAFKDEEDKFDLRLFLLTLNQLMPRELSIHKLLNELDIRGINKQAAFIMWIINLKENDNDNQ